MNLLIPNHSFTSDINLQIANADPLSATESIKTLAKLNVDSDTNEIINLFRQILPPKQLVTDAGFNEKMAIIRDLGMFLGSLKGHGIEPLTVVPEVEPLLFQISNETNMPPRDTIVHYTVWNPAGDAMRLYTGSEMEAEIVKGLQYCIPALERSLYVVEKLYFTPISDANFAVLCDEITGELEFLVDAFVAVYRKVPPLYFLDVLRPYYEPVKIGSDSHSGPGAIEIPLFLLDHALWACDSTNAEYIQMKERGLSHILPHWREMYHNLKGKPSITSTVINTLQQANYTTETSQVVGTNVKALDKIYNKLISFRLPHLKMADGSYGDEQPKFGKDREGYGTSILSLIIDLMKESRLQLTENSKKIRTLSTN